jgi:hypothetical protein
LNALRDWVFGVLGTVKKCHIAGEDHSKKNSRSSVSRSPN